MSINIVRFNYQNKLTWGVMDHSQITQLNIPCHSTRELIELGIEEIKKAKEESQTTLDAKSVELLSPITHDAKVLCQGANYRQHMLDSGMNPDDKNFNMFFTKSSASIHQPNGTVQRPSDVQLLDYEVELTLVLKANTSSAQRVTKNNLHEYIAGVCIGNDYSARDIQIPQMQFHKGKSYRTFCPLGPVLCLLEKDEMHYLDKFKLSLKVNGEPRQQDHTGNMVFKPAETLTEYSQITNFTPGDVLMTGTPSGCALGLPAPALVRMSGLLPESLKWKIFIKKQLARSQYLQPGDMVESNITTLDGKINLGTQSHTIVAQGA